MSSLNHDTYNRVWSIIDKYFGHSKGTVLIKHLLESYNDFVSNKIDDIIEGFNPIEMKTNYDQELDKFKNIISIEVKNPTLSNPMIVEKDGSTKIMTPMDARNRNFTYAAPCSVTVSVTIQLWNEENNNYTVETKKFNNISLGKLPIMVKSRYCILHNNLNIPGECKYDYGGYFIVNGNEKVVICQDRIAENKTYVFTNNKLTAYSHVAEIRSVLENKFSVPKTTSLKLSSKANQFGRYIRVNIHHIKCDIPIFILFRALGLETDKEIMQYIFYDLEDKDTQANKFFDQLIGSIEEANCVYTVREAREYLSKYMNISGYPKEILYNKTKRLEILNQVMTHEFLPHVGESFQKKALYLGYMVNKLIKCYMGILPFDDRDSYINKRVDTPGILIANIFRQYYGKVVKDLKNGISKEITVSARQPRQFFNVINSVNITKLIKSTTIESGIKYGLATGNWGIKSNKSKQGVAQVLNRMSYNATMSHLRRINTPIEKTGKLVQPRKLHSTQWGIICPAECFDPDTPILMWDGNTKKAKEIIVGDYLIDDKGNSVRVRTTCSGIKEMYEIIPDKKNFMSYTVTDNHILTLKVRNYKNIRNHRGNKEFSWFDKEELKFKYKEFDTDLALGTFKASIDDDDVIDITIDEYLGLPRNVKENLYVFKSDGINWEHKDVALDPYILGMWLGDGDSHGYGFATADSELLDKWKEWGQDHDATIKKGLKYHYSISSTINNTQDGISCNKTEPAPLKKLLSVYNLVKNKHIPMDYLVNDRKTRLSVLAGLVDTDGSVRANGHEIRICQGERNYRILYDAEFLARGLGFSCHVNDGISTYTVNGEKRQTPYKELSITGTKLSEIPTVLPRKKLNAFDNPTSEKRGASFMQSSFKLVKKDIQPFVGWQLEGNGRFLLSDCSISHNTPEGVSVGLVKNMSLIANISIVSNANGLRKVLSNDLGVVMFNGTVENLGLFAKNTRVIVNGDIIGIHMEPHVLYKTLKNMKRQGIISVYTCVSWNIFRNEINICTEGGRCLRPVFVVSEGNVANVLTPDIVSDAALKNMPWDQIVISDQNFVEYLDVEECNNSMIAMKSADLAKGFKGHTYPVQYTHLEMDLSLIMGVLAASIPFSNHNQAPRNCYQCLHPEEEVLMANGTRKMIKDVRVGDEVVTFDPVSHIPSYTKVIHQYVRPTDKKMYELETMSGCKVRATSNHPFMTSTGWKHLEDITVNDRLGIYMNNMVNYPHDDVNEYDVLTSDTFKENLTAINVNPTLIEKHSKTLTKLGLLPLTSRHPKLPIIARVAGFISTDGALNVYNKKHGGMTPQAQGDFGCEMDANMFEKDVEYLGFQKSDPKFQDRMIHGARHRSWKISHNGILANLLVSLKFHIGKKSNTPRKSLPDWIMNGSSLVKREFLSAWQGGDGNQVYAGKGVLKFHTMPVYHSVLPEYEDSLMVYMNQLGSLYTHMGVSVKEVKTIPDKTLKYGKIRVGVYFDDSEENFINIIRNVGYSYCDDKQMKTAKVLEYLYSDRTLDFNAFKETVQTKAYTAFVQIKSKKEIPTTLISDITVESDNHSFVTNLGALSSNSSMGKQAIGIYISNFKERFDTIGHVLNYPQLPFVQTKASRIVNNDKLPRGMNVIVAIMTYTGFNQEDSIIMNQSAVDRGMFTSTYYRTYKEQNNKNHSTGEEEFFCKPQIEANSMGKKPYNYDKLMQCGFVEENTYVETGDVIIGKCMPHKNGNIITHKDTSLVLKNNECGFIDKNCFDDENFPNTNGDGYEFAKVRIRSDRTPYIGDKFCLPPYAQVLTKYSGWTAICDITSEDMILQVDPVSGVMSYTKPTKVYHYPREVQDMIKFKGNNIDLLTTVNHTMPVQFGSDKIWKMVEAKELLHIDTHCTPIKYFKGIGVANVARQVDGVGVVKGPLAWLCGLFVKNGHLDVVDRSIVFHNLTFKAANDVCKLVNNAIIVTNDKAAKMIEADLCNVEIKNNEALYKILNKFDNLICIPHWICDHTSTAAAFMLGLLIGSNSLNTLDRKKQDAGRDNIIDYLSEERAASLQEVAVIAGYSADMFQAKDNKRSYSLHIRDIDYLNHSNDLFQDVEISKISYDGTVHCIEVPTHVFLVRMNGQMIFTGNSSNHGQKGTVGMMYRQEDMPFTRDGLVPDIIINPHAIPSRMTIAQLMECILGKACCYNGTQGDGTPFTGQSVEDIASVLEKTGMERYGNEMLYNSRTGEQINTNIFIGPTYYQRLKHMVSDKIHCTTGEIQVLTNSGWKLIPTVTMADKVACLRNGELVYEHPTAVLHFPNYKGKMYKISNSSIDLDVTINHRMWVKTCHTRQRVWSDYYLTKAENIVGKHVKYQKDAHWTAPDYQFILPTLDDNEEKVFDMDSWLTFFGIWMAEGCANNGAITGDTVFTTSVCVHKARVKAVLYDAVKTLGYHYNINKDVLTIRDKQLHNYMKVLSVGAPQKYLPDWVWELSMDQARKLQHAMCLGDGSFSKRTGCVMYYTASTRLADDFTRLCLHAGWSSTKSLHIPAGTENIIRGRAVTNNFDVWRLSVIKTKNNPSVNHGHTHHQEVQEEKVYDFEGSVYCLQVPSEVFYVRQNGKSCWTGNSRSSNGPILMLTRQPAEGRARDGGLRLGEMEIECNWAHGIMQFLKERFMECSDNYRVFVCKKCGMMANVNPEKCIYNCKNCKNTTDFAQIRIPFATKLLLQEVQTMSIGTKFLT